MPDGFCVTADAYVAFANRFAADDIVAAIERSVEGYDLKQATKLERELWHRVAGVGLPKDVWDEVVSQYDNLMSRIGHTAGCVSVRSSCTQEDSAELSFAGQFITSIDVAPGEGLREAILKCYFSRYLPRVAGYLLAAGEMHLFRTLRMAVLVQRMIPATFAGIAFTGERKENGANTVLLEYDRGLGEKSVSGSNVPRRVSIEGDVVVRETTSSGEDDLTDDVISRVFGNALRAQETMGCPQDVEWAYDGNDVWLLQSRAITRSLTR